MPVRVELAAEVFAETDDTTETYDLNDLLALVRCFVQERHEWVTDPMVVLAVQEFLPKQLPALADTYIALAREAAVARAWTGTSQAGDVVRVRRVDLGDYAADLCQPAVLVVEDQDSDGSFLRAVVHAFNAERVETALVRNWLEIHHGGGSGSLVKVAEVVAGRYRRLVRVVALLDSDRMIPRQRTPNHDKAERLHKAGVVVHVLALREAENYVPHRVLKEVGRVSDASRKLALLRQLTPEQRGHLDMKVGFGRADQPPTIHAEQAELFGPLEQQVLLGLRGGFGKDLLKRMEQNKATLTEQDFVSLGPEVAADLRALLVALASRI
jgi:hypothetical protein